MFYTEFTDEQKSVFLDQLNQLILADGVITEVEKEKLSEIKNIFPSITPQHIENCELKNIFVTRKDRLILLLELLSVSIADNNTSQENKYFLESLCKSIELSDYDMGWMNLWVTNVLNLNNLCENYINSWSHINILYIHSPFKIKVNRINDFWTLY